MPPVGFEPTVSASERPQTYALDRAATGPGAFYQQHLQFVGVFNVYTYKFGSKESSLAISK